MKISMWLDFEMRVAKQQLVHFRERLPKEWRWKLNCIGPTDLRTCILNQIEHTLSTAVQRSSACLQYVYWITRRSPRRRYGLCPLKIVRIYKLLMLDRLTHNKPQYQAHVNITELWTDSRDRQQDWTQYGYYTSSKEGNECRYGDLIFPINMTRQNSILWEVWMRSHVGFPIQDASRSKVLELSQRWRIWSHVKWGTIDLQHGP